jgi:hypothetical protein
MDVKWAVLLVAVWSAAMVGGAEEAAVTIDVAVEDRGEALKPRLVDISAWHFKHGWSKAAASQPAGAFKERYPFVDSVQFMSATGGSADRDLCVAPAETDADYRFDPLLEACAQVVRQGLRPFIKVGSVPLAMTAQPSIGEFGVNVRPPDRFEQYRRYVLALARAIVQRFGIDEVRGWRWGVVVEYENASWFLAADGTAETTKQAWFRTYDTVVDALQEALGRGNLTVGSHCMGPTGPGLWDEREFLDHVATGTNLCTGAVGTQLDYIATSFYEACPGKPGTLEVLHRSIGQLRERATALGLTSLRYGIDEGTFLQGPDHRELQQDRTVGSCYQGSIDAVLLKKMHDLDIAWVARWSLNSEAVWGAVEGVVGNVARLGHRLTGGRRLQLAVSGSPRDARSMVDGIACYDAARDAVKILLYHHHPAFAFKDSQPIRLRLRLPAQRAPGAVELRQWIVDERHSSYYATWKADAAAAKVRFQNSEWLQTVVWDLADEASIACWKSHEVGYAALARLMEPIVSRADPINGSLAIDVDMDHHAVMLFEVRLDSRRQEP